MRSGVAFLSPGLIPMGEPTPRRDLDLRPGDFVRVKSFQEIRATLDITGSNRHLFFDAELVPYCGRVYRVKARVENFVDEKTGKMQRLRTPAVILEGVIADPLYGGPTDVLPSQLYSWWREIWLEKVSEAPAEREVTCEERKVARIGLRLPPVLSLLPLRNFTK